MPNVRRPWKRGRKKSARKFKRRTNEKVPRSIVAMKQGCAMITSMSLAKRPKIKRLLSS